MEARKGEKDSVFYVVSYCKCTVIGLHLKAGSEGGRRLGKVEGHRMIVTVRLLLDGRRGVG